MLLNTVSHTLSQVLDLSQTHSLIIACSAGPDSVCMAHSIAALVPGQHHLLYINHHQRPSEAKAEEYFITKLGKQLGMTVHLESIDPSCQTHQQFREARLAIFDQLATTLDCSIICLGHHRDDDIETVFQQLGKGATFGLKGISLQTNMPTMQLLHPLIHCSKSDIQSFLSSESIDYCTDSSNLSMDYQRNRLRPIIQGFFDACDTNSMQVVQSLDYLKRIHLHQVDKSNAIMDQGRRLGASMCWLKTDVLRMSSDPVVDVSVMIEQHWNQYVNKDHQRILAQNLASTAFKSLQLQTIQVDTDYKWMLIRPIDTNNSNECNQLLLNFKDTDELSHNRLCSFGFGKLCLTLLHQPLNSNLNRCCLSMDQLKWVTVTTIADSILTIPNQKKRLRNAQLSPIQQRWWPMLVVDNVVVWIPGVVAAEGTGDYCITYRCEVST